MPPSDLTSLFRLLPALGVAGPAFVWLLFQVATPRRTGWVTAVAVPAALAGFAAFAVLPGIPNRFPSNPAAILLGLAVAVGAGLLFDQTSSLRPRERTLQARRSPWPLLVWGVGMLLYVAAPALGQGPDGRPTLDRWAGAVGLVGTSALIGQALGWVWRLSRGQARPNAVGHSPAAGVVRRLAGFTGGAAAALLATWLALPALDGLAGKNGQRSSTTGPPTAGPAQAPRKAPADALLVNGIPKAGKAMGLFVLDVTTGRYQSLQLAGRGLGWSHDGTRLAFTRPEGDFENLWVATADGREPRRLTNLPGNIREAVWSADGRQIYFGFGKSFFGRPGLWVVSTAGGTAEEVLANSEGVNFPALSPDGRTLAYYRDGPVVNLVAYPGEIKLLDLSTRRANLLVRLPNTSWNVTGLTWAPNGKALLVGASERYNGPYRLIRIPLATPQLLHLGASFAQYPSGFTLTSDGSLALVASVQGRGGAPGNREIWLVDLDSGNKRPLATDGSVAPYFIRASPVAKAARSE
jgi:hypothetical protein